MGAEAGCGGGWVRGWCRDVYGCQVRLCSCSPTCSSSRRTCRFTLSLSTSRRTWFPPHPCTPPHITLTCHRTSPTPSSSTEALLACGTSDGCVSLYDIRAPSLVPAISVQIDPARAPVVSVALEPASFTGRLIAASGSADLRIFDLRVATQGEEAPAGPSHAMVCEVAAHSRHPMVAMAAHPNAPLVATASSGRVVKMFDLEGQQIGALQGPGRSRGMGTLLGALGGQVTIASDVNQPRTALPLHRVWPDLMARAGERDGWPLSPIAGQGQGAGAVAGSAGVQPSGARVGARVPGRRGRLPDHDASGLDAKYPTDLVCHLHYCPVCDGHPHPQDPRHRVCVRLLASVLVARSLAGRPGQHMPSRLPLNSQLGAT